VGCANACTCTRLALSARVPQTQIQSAPSDTDIVHAHVARNAVCASNRRLLPTELPTKLDIAHGARGLASHVQSPTFQGASNDFQADLTVELDGRILTRIKFANHSQMDETR
jgi:hypothetical protein